MVRVKSQTRIQYHDYVIYDYLVAARSTDYDVNSRVFKT